ncbi:MAG TPA: hypothetical protein VMF67_11415 [Rhizomicrobium sp.]|nr:hypothetical protein [Rhizomicrobium sp.]
MKWAFLALAICTALLIANSSVGAQDVIDFADFSALQNQSGGYANVNVEQYSVANGISSGGGQFIIGQGSTGIRPLHGCKVDDGVVFTDEVIIGQQANCYYRQFSGAVHLSWYGPSDARSSNCLPPSGVRSNCDEEPVLAKALAAALTYGNGRVTTDGIPIVIYQNLTIPSGEAVDCGGVPNGYLNQTQNQSGSVYYWQLPNTLVLNPSATITVGGSGAPASLDSCAIIPTWYAPAGTGTCSDTETSFNLPALCPTDVYLMTNNWSGTAVTCGGAKCGMHNLFIVGFDTGVNIVQATESDLGPFNIEANVPVYVNNNGSGLHVGHVLVKQYLEQQLQDSNGNRIDQVQDGIVGMGSDDTGTYIFVLTPSGVPSLPWSSTGMPILIGGLGQNTNFQIGGIAVSTTTNVISLPADTGKGYGADDVFTMQTVSDSLGYIPTSTTCCYVGNVTLRPHP